MKRVLIINLLFLLVFSLNASEFLFGIKGGANLGFFSGDELSDNLNDYFESELGTTCSSKNEGGIGVHLGVFLIIPLSNKLSLQTELIYKYTEPKVQIDPDWMSDIFYIEKYEYIELPIMLNVDVIDYFSLYGGGFFQYLIGAESVLSSRYGSYESEAEIDDYYLNEFAYGICAGIDYSTPLKKTTWIADLRLNYQLAPFTRNSDITPAIMTVDFSLGFGF